MTSSFHSIGVVGGGAWGTALALAALRAGRSTLLWAREPAVVDAINTAHENRDYLPGVTLPAELMATADLAEVGACDAVLLVTPAQHLRSVCAKLAPHLRPGAPAVICAKGIEIETQALMYDAVEAALPPGTPVAILSGPTFAAEVARGLPTAVTLACRDAAVGTKLVEALGSLTFRPYLTDDVIGAQVGGAVKNVLAIACGVVAGRKFGDNARAALITRGLAEITRLALRLGARPETLMGLSGLGDLTLTCSSLQSRNMSLGVALGEGRTLDEVLGERRSVAEGVYTARAVVALAGRLGVEMPICAAVDAILNRGASVDDTVQGLLSRPFREEAA
ncbi:MAG TPA: NAD(P)H-dependent glycerol-3-phosphate dehydrogenase [Azospirillum sp.]|nr:NAD(P)H-dependent glycerol-3-phosphate dehydrogenase [Azospirillum sp.]